MNAADPRGAGRPLIVHVVHRFDVGGMENGIVNLVNGLPEPLADHCVLALTEAAPSFVRRIQRSGVRVLELRKPPGPLLRFLPAVFRQLRSLRPAVVHTRNVGTLEAQLAAFAAGVPVRIHGEHGWDVGDLAGENAGLLRVRRVLRHFVHHQIALSAPTYRYLVDRVGVPPERVTNICNGVDVARFRPAPSIAEARSLLASMAPGLADSLPADGFVVGAVGRLAEVKNPLLLITAFAMVRRRNESFARTARLAIVGDGPLESAVRARVQAEGLDGVSWLAGRRDDVPSCLQALDLLCLPSLAEGISNAILEALACGVPVVATDVGGNRELLKHGETGVIVPSGDAAALADAIERQFSDPTENRRMGHAARAAAVSQFSLAGMIDEYQDIYARQLARVGRYTAPSKGTARSVLDA